MLANFVDFMFELLVAPKYINVSMENNALS